MSHSPRAVAVHTLILSAFVLLQVRNTNAVPAPPLLNQPQVIGSTVSLSWNVAFGVTGIRLEAGTAPGLSNAANALIGAIGAYTATNVPLGVYYVRVRAIDGTWESAPSNEVTVVVGGASPTPGCTAPPALGTLFSYSVSGNIVTFALPSVLPLVGRGLTSYRIEAGSGLALSNLAQLVVPASQRRLPVAAPAGAYWVRAFAENACGRSGATNELLVLVGGGSAPNTVTGRWSGSTVLGPCAWALSLDLLQSGNNVTGTYDFSVDDALPTCPAIATDPHSWGVVTGSATAGVVQLTLTARGPTLTTDPGGTYEGSFNATTRQIVGTLRPTPSPRVPAGSPVIALNPRQ